MSYGSHAPYYRRGERKIVDEEGEEDQQGVAARHINDPFVKLAQREGYRARAAYKLKEIDETLSLRGPGSWSSTSARRRAPGASTYGAGSRRERRHGGRSGALTERIIALDSADGAIEGVDLYPGRLP